MSLFVTSQINKTVREYDVTTGAFLKVAASGGALGDPLDVVIGIDGNLLVSDGQTKSGETLQPRDRRVHRRICVN